MKWEYKVIFVNLADAPYNSPEAMLNKMGCDEWELVTMWWAVDTGDFTPKFVFKRPAL